MSINILSIPMIDGGLSHQIPLFVLNQTQFQRIESVTNNFLLPKALHNSFNKKGVHVLEQDYNIPLDQLENPSVDVAKTLLNIESKAYTSVKPDIIIEDCCFTSPLIAEKNNVPRISIQRTGFFRTIDQDKRNKKHQHSLETKANLFFLENAYSTAKKSNRNDKELLYSYLNSDVKIIPGIPLIERLPDSMEHKDSFFYSGPLLLQDNLSDKSLIDRISLFLEKNKSRKKVFITSGLISKQNVAEFIEVLLEKEYAVFTTSALDNETAKKEQLFVHDFYPLNLISSIVDLVIHQCGSGIYHYPLLNKKPVITFGTQCYDREDVALRLEELRLSKHVPSPLDDKDYLEVFKSHLNDFENSALSDPEQLHLVQNEIVNTMKTFNPIEVLEYSFNHVN